MVVVSVLGAALAMMGVEPAMPGRRWPRVAGWWARAILLNGAQAAIVYLAGWAWDPWLSRHRPSSADSLGTVTGGLVGYVVVTFIYYWWHRWRHEVPVLWRRFHPEIHCVHHQEGLHSYNFSGLPVWDMLFGTFRNPREHPPLVEELRLPKGESYRLRVAPKHPTAIPMLLIPSCSR